jgi:hypothetical protein
MLARLALLFVMLPTLAIAAAADVIPDGGKLVIPPPPKPVTQSPYVAYAAPTMPAANASECRMDCAQTLYFCQASDHAEYCPSGWTECVAACNSPALNHAP